MDTESDDFNTWAVVMAPGGTFIGKPHIKEKKELTDGDISVVFNPCFQIQVHVMPVPAGPGKIAMQREISCLPFITTLQDGAPVWVRASIVQFMEDLKPADRARYKGLVNQAIAIQNKLRADDAGLHLADQMPGGRPPGNA